MVDKNFCMSSYLAFRYIEKDGYEFMMDLSIQVICPIQKIGRYW